MIVYYTFEYIWEFVSGRCSTFVGLLPEVIVGFGLYEWMDKWAYLIVCGGLAMPLLLQPLVLPSLTKEASVPLMQRFCTKANVWIAIFSFLGALDGNFSLDCFGWYMELKSAWRFLNEDCICSSVYRSRKDTRCHCTGLWCFCEFSGSLYVDVSIRQGHGGAWWGTRFDIGPIVASRRLGVWGNYWGTHYFYCVLKAILIWSFWCWWHFFNKLKADANVSNEKVLIDYSMWEGVFNFVAACD